MSWSNAYVGIPYADHGRDRHGCDCWGLVRLVYGQELDIALPSLSGDYLSAEEAREVSELIHRERAGWIPVERPQPFDVITLRMAGLERHVGLVVEPGVMLHILRGIDAAHENYTNPLWHRRVTGFYRHRRRTA